VKAKVRPSEGRTQRLATGVGWVSLGMGAAMSLDPRRSAALLGWADRGGLARLVGGVDLILGAGLLRGRRRERWMLARALLNAIIGLIYARVLAEGRPDRTPGGLGRHDGRFNPLRLLALAPAQRGRNPVARGRYP
jgi:hypothetical protein